MLAPNVKKIVQKRPTHTLLIFFHEPDTMTLRLQTFNPSHKLFTKTINKQNFDDIFIDSFMDLKSLFQELEDKVVVDLEAGLLKINERIQINNRVRERMHTVRLDSMETGELEIMERSDRDNQGMQEQKTDLIDCLSSLKDSSLKLKDSITKYQSQGLNIVNFKKSFERGLKEIEQMTELFGLLKTKLQKKLSNNQKQDEVEIEDHNEQMQEEQSQSVKAQSSMKSFQLRQIKRRKGGKRIVRPSRLQLIKKEGVEIFEIKGNRVTCTREGRLANQMVIDYTLNQRTVYTRFRILITSTKSSSIFIGLLPRGHMKRTQTTCAIVYKGETGELIDNQFVKQVGTGFGRGDLVEVRLHKGEAQWFVNGVLHVAYPLDTRKSNGNFMPFVQMDTVGDVIQWVSC